MILSSSTFNTRYFSFSNRSPVPRRASLLVKPRPAATASSAEIYKWLMYEIIWRTLWRVMKELWRTICQTECIDILLMHSMCVTIYNDQCSNPRSINQHSFVPKIHHKKVVWKLKPLDGFFLQNFTIHSDLHDQARVALVTYRDLVLKLFMLKVAFMRLAICQATALLSWKYERFGHYGQS